MADSGHFPIAAADPKLWIESNPITMKMTRFLESFVAWIASGYPMAALAALFIAPAAWGAEAEGQEAPKPEIKVGDQWTYRYVNFLKQNLDFTFDLQVTYAGPDSILSLMTRGDNQHEFDLSHSSEWNAYTTGGGQVYRPLRKFFSFPLVAGTSFPAKYEIAAKRRSKVRTIYEQDVRVVGWEEIEVPAGRFRAIKVEASGTYRRLDVNSSGWARSSIWYVSSVKRWVKFTYEDGNSARQWTSYAEELVAFSGLARSAYDPLNQL